MFQRTFPVPENQVFSKYTIGSVRLILPTSHSASPHATIQLTIVNSIVATFLVTIVNWIVAGVVGARWRDCFSSKKAAATVIEVGGGFDQFTIERK